MSPRLVPLFIGPAERAKLAELTARAAASPTDHATMLQVQRADQQGQGARLREMNHGLTVEIPTAFTVTLTHEEQQPGVMCRHVSVGCRTAPGRGPSPTAVNMVLEALGFVNRIGVKGLPIWLENLADGTAAINVMEPLDGNLDRLR